MKVSVAQRLAQEGFNVVMEPPFSPLRYLWWSRYRPDLFGFRRSEGFREYVFAECETNPISKRIHTKRIDSVMWQTLLLEGMRARFLLVVPRGTLLRVCDSLIRHVWDIWVYESQNGIVEEFPKLSAG